MNHLHYRDRPNWDFNSSAASPMRCQDWDIGTDPFSILRNRHLPRRTHDMAADSAPVRRKAYPEAVEVNRIDLPAG